MNIEHKENELKGLYADKFHSERLKIRYLNLKEHLTNYALEYCISDYEKIGLSESEIECIKNRSYTFLTYYRAFNHNQKENFPKIYNNTL